jgi:ubiquinone/menaquinone biosynthesis C-methylase UbiE
MSYFSLAQRVTETSAVDPKILAWLYGLIVRVPLVRAVYRQLLDGILQQDIAKGDVLDLGTGPGYVAIQLGRQRPGLRIVGLDLAAHMVQQAKRNAAKAGLDGRGLWPHADAQRLPFADNSFELVISSFALHHWSEPLKILNEIARVLQPGGHYFLADLCRQPNLAQRLFAYASIPAISLPFGSYLGYGGYYESVRAGHTLAEAENLLARSSLPPGLVSPRSTWFVPILTIRSQNPSEKAQGNGSSHPDATEAATTNQGSSQAQTASRGRA